MGDLILVILNNKGYYLLKNKIKYVGLGTLLIFFYELCIINMLYC